MLQKDEISGRFKSISVDSYYLETVAPEIKRPSEIATKRKMKEMRQLRDRQTESGNFFSKLFGCFTKSA
ncbi:MAG TPA: hypothetical protein V6C72_06545 [Chroococcales cyanobacterium]